MSWTLLGHLGYCAVSMHMFGVSVICVGGERLAEQCYSRAADSFIGTPYTTDDSQLV
jgi:hypothetical protein